MGLTKISCHVLVCDDCGEDLVDPMDSVQPHYPEGGPMELDARSLYGWTTDGRGLWHCGECPPLVFDDGSQVMPGQLVLAGGEDPMVVIPPESSPGRAGGPGISGSVRE